MAFKKSSILPVLFSTFLALFIIIIPLIIPLPRQIGLSVRYDWISVALLGGGGLFLLWFRKTMPWQILSLGCVILLFELSLVGLWSSGQSEVYVLNGVLPWNDANHYFTDALRVLAGGSMEAFSTRRPLAPLFFSLLLFFTGGNVQAVQVFLALLSAFSCYVAGREIQREFNTLTAVFFTLLLFLFSRRFTGMLMTENLGMPLGTLGFVLLLRGARNRNLSSLLVGILALTLALNARAGAFFAVPLIALWISWFFCNRFKHLGKNLLLITAVILGFAVNGIAFRLVSPPGAMLFSNFADTLYGAVVGGKGWEQVSRDYPEIENMPEDQRAGVIYSLTWDHFKQEPQLLAKGAFSSWIEFFSLSDDSVFGFINGERKNEIKITIIAGCLMLYLLSGLGFYYLIKNLKFPSSALILAAWIGMILSVPLVPPQDATRMRVYAATIAFIAFLPALGLYTLWKIVKKEINKADSLPVTEEKWVSLPLVSTLVLIFLVCGAGLFIKLLPATMVQNTIDCPPGEEAIVFQMTQGSTIHVVKDEAVNQDWLPDIRKKRFVIGVHGISTAFSDALEQVEAPFILTSGINLINHQSVFLIIPDVVGSLSNGRLAMCGVKTSSPVLDSMNFLEVKTVSQP